MKLPAELCYSKLVLHLYWPDTGGIYIIGSTCPAKVQKRVFNIENLMRAV